MSSTVSAYTPITTSGQITYTGLGNGTDFSALITKLVQVEQSRITTLQTWKQSWTIKQSAFQALNTQMLSLRTTLKGMDTEGEFMAKLADSSNSSILTASTSSGAVDGSHTIDVVRQATAKSMVTHSGFTSADSNINPSGSDENFAYTYKGTTYSNSIGTNCSLTDLCNIINNDANNPGVKASVVYDGSNYFLQLRGMDTGDSAALTIASSTTLADFTASDFDTVASNASAQLKLDGWPTAAGSYIVRETNTVSDLIPGVTLNLKGKGTVNLTISTDTDTIKQNIQTFVQQMNTVRTMLQELTKYDSSTQQASILTGNYGVDLINSNLESAVADKGIGFDYTRDKYSVLSQLGINTDDSEGSETEGLLTIDDSVLDPILASNASAVGQLFAASYSGGSESSDFSLSSYVSGTTKCGTYDVSYTVDGSGKITAATINGHQAIFHSNSNLITGAQGYDEAGLVIKAIDTTPGTTHSGTVYLKQGKMGELSDLLGELTDSKNGPMNILYSNYTDITNMIDDKIAFEKQRINTYASNLRARFAKVDSLLSTYSQMQTQLTSSISQLSSSSSS